MISTDVCPRQQRFLSLLRRQTEYEKNTKKIRKKLCDKIVRIKILAVTLSLFRGHTSIKMRSSYIIVHWR